MSSSCPRRARSLKQNPIGLTQEKLKEWLSYDPLTGVFRWKKNPREHMGDRMTGRIAGCKCRTNGYVIIQFKGCRDYAHRLAVLYMTGEMPKALVDHANRDKADNRWSNLRPASKSQNAINNGKKAIRSSRYRGVSLDRKRDKWLAKIKANGKERYIGLYSSEDEAARARDVVARELFGPYAALNFEPTGLPGGELAACQALVREGYRIE
jgi:hypothetical protein